MKQNKIMTFLNISRSKSNVLDLFYFFTKGKKMLEQNYVVLHRVVQMHHTTNKPIDQLFHVFTNQNWFENPLIIEIQPSKNNKKDQNENTS